MILLFLLTLRLALREKDKLGLTDKYLLSKMLLIYFNTYFLNNLNPLRSEGGIVESPQPRHSPFWRDHATSKPGRVIQVKNKNIIFDLNKAFYVFKLLIYPIVVNSNIKYRCSSKFQIPRKILQVLILFVSNNL